jgi:hypothetical protein
MLTSELAGLFLDWAVTTIEDPDALRFGVADWREQRKTKTVNGEYVHRYHQSWSQAGPIISRRIWAFDHMQTDRVCAMIKRNDMMNGGWNYGYGPDPITAALRCIVSSELGDEVEIPEVLRLPAG